MSTHWLLLRGLAREKRHWFDFYDHLNNSHDAKITCIDLPGFGDFHKLSSPSRISFIAEFVYSQLLTTDYQKGFVFGISLGGMVATELVRLYPDKFKAMILLNSSFRNFSSMTERLQMNAYLHMARAAMAKSEADRERAIFNMVSNRIDKEKFIVRSTEYAREKPMRPLNIIKQLVAASTYAAPMVKPIKNTYIITSEGDRMVQPSCSQAIANKWAAPLKTHESGGHELSLDEPEWLVKTCLEIKEEVTLSQDDPTSNPSTL